MKTILVGATIVLIGIGVIYVLWNMRTEKAATDESSGKIDNREKEDQKETVVKSAPVAKDTSKTQSNETTSPDTSKPESPIVNATKNDTNTEKKEDNTSKNPVVNTVEETKTTKVGMTNQNTEESKKNNTASETPKDAKKSISEKNNEADIKEKNNAADNKEKNNEAGNANTRKSSSSDEDATIEKESTGSSGSSSN